MIITIKAHDAVVAVDSVDTFHTNFEPFLWFDDEHIRWFLLQNKQVCK